MSCRNSACLPHDLPTMKTLHAVTVWSYQPVPVLCRSSNYLLRCVDIVPVLSPVLSKHNIHVNEPCASTIKGQITWQLKRCAPPGQCNTSAIAAQINVLRVCKCSKHAWTLTVRSSMSCLLTYVCNPTMDKETTHTSVTIKVISSLGVHDCQCVCWLDLVPPLLK